MSESSHTIVIVCEAEADARLCRDLAMRVLCENIDWLPDNPSLIRWQGLEAHQSYLRIHSLKELGKDDAYRFRPTGSFGGRGSTGYGLLLKKAQWILSKKFADNPPSALFFMFDTDNDRERIADAQNAVLSQIPIVLATPHTKRECWVLAGFVPSPPEHTTLNELKSELSFDPCRESHRLKGKNDPRCAKRILTTLSKNSFEREEQCWRETPLATLETNGQENMLKEFLSAVRELAKKF